MNQQQRKYAKERVANIYAQKKVAIIEKHSKPGKQITGPQRATLIRQGKVKLKPDVKSVSTYADVVDVFDFSKYHYSSTVDNAKSEKELANLKSEYAKVMDEVMLGDAKEAIELIKQFGKL